jgi:hypothetical protein
MHRLLPALLLACTLLVRLAPAPTRALQGTADLENYTFRLEQSTPAYQVWTAPPSERVFLDSPLPSAAAAEIKVYAAGREFEPFQVVVRPAASGSLAVSIDPFGPAVRNEIYQVKYAPVAAPSDSLGRAGPYPDPLWPLQNGAAVDLAAGENTALWFSLYVPPGTASGDYTTLVHLGAISIPVRLHVFNFDLPAALHLESQMNFSYQAFLESYSVPGTGREYWDFVEATRQYFIDHRLTPSSVLWPGGLTGGGSFAEPFIDYNCAAHTFSDPYGIWGFEELAQRYLAGTGLLQGQFSAPFNGGSGFPSFMAASFAHNDSSVDQRPDTFCGQARSASDWLQNPTSAYNQAWFAYLAAMQGYLQGQGYLGQAYHYFANEPQDQAGYDAVAWYSRYAHAAAPGLKLMVSEEPKPEIYDQPGAHIDTWLPVLQSYDPEVSHRRFLDHGEETWIYFLHSTRPPYFNPITLDHPGVESKLTGWFAWKYRLRGIAYYALNDWGKNPWLDPLTAGHNGDTFMLYPPAENNQPIPYGANQLRFVPSIRFELLRDSLEDYEYLYLLGSGQPQVGETNAADPQVDKVIGGLTSYTRSSEFLYNLRRLVGLKNGGEIAGIPDIQPAPIHPRAQGAPGRYYLNFQDPAGEPRADPLVVDGKTYLKIGASSYSQAEGLGWYSPPDAHWMTAWLDEGPNLLQRSILYSDWGRPAAFDFALPNGQYQVTLSVGWQGRTYTHQKVEIEGVSFVDDEATTPAAPYLVRSRTLAVRDNLLSMAIGIFDEYTMLNYLEIEAANPPVSDLRLSGASLSAGRLSGTLHWTPPSGAALTAVRYANAPIDAASWESAAVLAAALPGSQGQLAVDLPYSGGVIYFALRAQDAQGGWSGVSNNTAWSSLRIHLPLLSDF